MHFGAKLECMVDRKNWKERTLVLLGFGQETRVIPGLQYKAIVTPKVKCNFRCERCNLILLETVKKL